MDGISCGVVTCEGLAQMRGFDYCTKGFSSGYLSRCANGTDGQLQDFCRWSCRNCGTLVIDTIIASKLEEKFFSMMPI